MTVPPELMKLWQSYSGATFPEGYVGKKINQIDLALVDAEIAGCVRLFILNDGKIDPQQLNVLRDRLIDLNAIILLMDRDELIYFERLRKMANLVLQEVEKIVG
jgi:hypothetical protein